MLAACCILECHYYDQTGRRDSSNYVHTISVCMYIQQRIGADGFCLDSFHQLFITHPNKALKLNCILANINGIVDRWDGETDLVLLCMTS